MIMHLRMIWKSIELVALGFLILLMVIGFVFASASLGQWRVDQNMARFEMAEGVNQNDR